MNGELEKKLSRLIDRLDALLPPDPGDVDWSQSAFRWERRPYLGMTAGRLEAVRCPALISGGELLHVQRQKELLFSNTESFVRGLPANNVLLTGARGSGKSSLIRACLMAYRAEGLRLIEVSRDFLTDLPDIVKVVAGRPERFILFCDDLTFEQGEGGYRALKAALDGSIAGGSGNTLVYATSNRRHLMPERAADNLDSSLDADGLLHPAETIEEQLSLSERFGLWLSFYPFSQDEYLDIVGLWLRELGVPEQRAASPEMRVSALQFALGRGSRSGRVAQQFARAAAACVARGRPLP
ncbi:ATP-binding protein [Mesosutterella sp. OilRF-GAM-744-9]|uniref:ATP-binding protein n=1 Tax=Mesosutterella porci TaxID=2915351 RepID=A0ABS9MTE1_9BURK|nr:ATP-binding protein [Mesosutterella sp. oilRF-744-WT-GAM-9]MCG5031268.1 ATP-binding protein [Mesosutterella sp. oilRF-744-WT-GAM-9]MCI6531005.1 ATP-binding protein [Mesosutterella sp.]